MQSTSITIPSGATLSGLAASNGTTVSALMAANPSITDADKIQAGATLNVPKPAVIQTSTAQRSTTAQNVNDHNTLVSKITAPSTPTTGAVGVSGGANGADSSNIDSTTGQPTGAVGFKLDAAGNKTWTDAAGNPLADSSDQRTSILGKTADIQSQGNDSIRALNDTLKTALSYSDAVGAANIQQIMQMYQSRINSIQSSYDRLGVSKNEANNRTGLARYAPDQAQGILTDVEVTAQQKISDLVTQMSNAVTKAQSALQSGDLKTFNDTSKQIKDLQKGMTTEVNNLYKEAQKYNSDVIKTEQQNIKDTQAQHESDIKEATAAAPYLLSQKSKYGTDDKWQAFLDSYAKESGIDPEILKGEVQGYSDKQSKSSKTSSSNKDGGTSGTFAYTNQDVTDISSILKTGGTIKGTTYGGRTGGYSDASLYQTLADGWESQGGKMADFVKAFPPSDYVNPDDNSKLPTYLQNKSGKKSSSDGGAASPSSPFKPASNDEASPPSK